MPEPNLPAYMIISIIELVPAGQSGEIGVMRHQNLAISVQLIVFCVISPWNLIPHWF